jgi:vacuolar-type H+-ATPase subunit I/STV1
MKKKLVSDLIQHANQKFADEKFSEILQDLQEFNKLEDMPFYKIYLVKFLKFIPDLNDIYWGDFLYFESEYEKQLLMIWLLSTFSSSVDYEIYYEEDEKPKIRVIIMVKNKDNNEVKKYLDEMYLFQKDRLHFIYLEEILHLFHLKITGTEEDKACIEQNQILKIKKAKFLFNFQKKMLNKNK